MPPVTNPERRFNLWRWMILLLATVIAAMLIVGGFFYRQYQADKETAKAELTAARLCVAIVNLAQGSDPANLKPGDYGYSYAREHPDEVRNYQRRDPVEIARALGCPQTKEMP